MFELILASLFSTAFGHGAMVWPYTWFDHEGFGWTEKSMCMPGCDLNQDTLGGPGCQCFWFTNSTTITNATLNAPELRTYHDIEGEDWTKDNPWRHPGAAEIYSPCGVAGGNPEGCDQNCPFDAYAYGPAAENYSFPWAARTTTWQKGSVVEAGWGITANKGGGYSYRLCKIPDDGDVTGLTEECFQKTPLRFHGDKQWARFGWSGQRVEINATRTTKGTVPKGSQWTKNPIPACDSVNGGFSDDLEFGCPDGPTDVQFPSPNADEGLYGYGGSAFDFNRAFRFSIMDELKVPADLEEGLYVLSWRWDCEQTPQVWNTCSRIRIVNSP